MTRLIKLEAPLALEASRKSLYTTLYNNCHKTHNLDVVDCEW